MNVHLVRALYVAATMGLVAGGSEPTARAEGSAPEPAPTRTVEVDVRAQNVVGAPRSPGLAALLSLTPVPVDFGNFYAENVDWGIAFTSGELVLGGAMMWVGASHMCHHSAAGDGCPSWSTSERNTMLGLATGYVAVKIFAAFEAASAARTYNEQRRPMWQPVVAPTIGGGVVGWAAQF